jgi:histidinol-phosphate/aromatic aminotransferase/cobyric acid decarboxylase-like protein
VNACAQAAGLAALRARGYYEAQWAGLRKLAADLARDLAEAGFPPLPSSGNFLLFRAGNTGRLRDFLWERRILARDCSSFGLSGYVRVGVKSGEENRRLVECLAAYRKEAS